MDLILGQKKVHSKLQYRVTWYLYHSEDDKIEPAKHITQHFITCHRDQKTQKTTRRFTHE